MKRLPLNEVEAIRKGESINYNRVDANMYDYIVIDASGDYYKVNVGNGAIYIVVPLDDEITANTKWVKPKSLGWFWRFMFKLAGQ